VVICTNGGARDEAFRETRRIFRGTRTKTYGKGLEDLAGRLDALLAHLT